MSTRFSEAWRSLIRRKNCTLGLLNVSVKLLSPFGSMNAMVWCDRSPARE